MKLLLPTLLPFLLAGRVLAESSAAAAPVTAHIDGRGASVITFLPPVLKGSHEAHARQAREFVRMAVQDTKRCLGEHTASFKIVFAQRIVVRSRRGRETFELGTDSALVGALLLRPGANARILFAGGGPEALSSMLVPAAAEYFGKVCTNG